MVEGGAHGLARPVYIIGGGDTAVKKSSMSNVLLSRTGKWFTAAFTITTGFKPRYVKILNVDGLCMEEWIEGMADASALKTVDSGSGTTPPTVRG
jgi:hypothetical protein